MEENPYQSPANPAPEPLKPRLDLMSYVGWAVDIMVWFALFVIGVALIVAVLFMLGVIPSR